jgi:integrase
MLNVPFHALNAIVHGNIRPTLTKAGLGWVNYQVLRRSAVTLLNAECHADPTIIAAQMGHTVDVSTNVYNKVGTQRQQNAIQTLDNALHSNHTRQPKLTGPLTYQDSN